MQRIRLLEVSRKAVTAIKFNAVHSVIHNSFPIMTSLFICQFKWQIWDDKWTPSRITQSSSNVNQFLANNDWCQLTTSSSFDRQLTNIVKSLFIIIQPLTNIIKSLVNIVKSLFIIIQSLVDIIMSLVNIIQSLVNIIKSLVNIVKSLFITFNR